MAPKSLTTVPSRNDVYVPPLQDPEQDCGYLDLQSKGEMKPYIEFQGKVSKDHASFALYC